MEFLNVQDIQLTSINVEFFGIRMIVSFLESIKKEYSTSQDHFYYCLITASNIALNVFTSILFPHFLIKSITMDQMHEQFLSDLIQDYFQ